MSQEKVKNMQQIVDVHVKRIQDAAQYLNHVKTFPLNANTVQNLNHEQILYLEMLTSRFAKLQDFLGASVFDLFFDIEQESYEDMTMIDKLNKLEKLNIIADAHIWREMRKLRNIIEHEYPDNPDLMANTLNAIFNLFPTLLDISNKIFGKISKAE